MTVTFADITARAARATAELEVQRRSAIELVTAGADATRWARFANALAEVEGKAHAWAYLERISTNRETITEEFVSAVAAGLLINGADDSWSGRGCSGCDPRQE